MKMPIKPRMYYPLLAILLVGLLCACASPAAAPDPPPKEPSEPTGTTPDESPTTDGSSGASDRVDVVYFHRPRRCVTCLCFEERIRHVVKTYFQGDVDSGKLTLEVLSLGDEENAAIINKYSAFGPQLFINIMRDGADHITDIEDIWSWGCTSNPEGFDEALKSTIEQSLEEVE